MPDCSWPELALPCMVLANQLYRCFQQLSSSRKLPTLSQKQYCDPNRVFQQNSSGFLSLLGELLSVPSKLVYLDLVVCSLYLNFEADQSFRVGSSVTPYRRSCWANCRSPRQREKPQAQQGVFGD